MKHYFKIACIISVILLLVGGCGKAPDEIQSSNELTEIGTTYPLNSDVTLKYWMILPSNTAATASSMSDTPYGKELMKRTGINIEYIHATTEEQFNLLLASDDLPDIIEYDWTKFPGGLEKAYKSDYITDLNGLFDYAPNLRKYLDENPDIDKMAKTDDGKYLMFPFIRGDEYLLVSAGPVMRKDWLDELGLPIPTTMNQWYETLKAFKQEKGATIPLSFSPYANFFKFGLFTGAYGVINGYYVEEGKVKYGPVEPGYKDFIITMRKWYEEGLLDRNFVTAETKAVDASLLDGRTGATAGSVGSGIGRWLSAVEGQDTTFDLVGVPYPVLTEGERPKFGHRQWPYTGYGGVISSTSGNKELAALLLDYAYSDDGIMLNNFGIEGESYTIIEGYPTYTDLIMKNPENLSISYAMGKYQRANYNAPMIQDKRYMEQYASDPRQKEALLTWMDTDTEKYALPPVSLAEESSEMAKITNEVNTYQSEMMIKFIMALEPMENYDKYLEQMNKLGVDRLIDIQQTALEKYNKR